MTISNSTEGKKSVRLSNKPIFPRIPRVQCYGRWPLPLPARLGHQGPRTVLLAAIDQTPVRSLRSQSNHRRKRIEKFDGVLRSECRVWRRCSHQLHCLVLFQPIDGNGFSINKLRSIRYGRQRPIDESPIEFPESGPKLGWRAEY